MVDFVEGLADWGVKELVDGILKNYTTQNPPLIAAADVPMFEKVGIDIANAAFMVAAQKVGIPTK